MPALCRHCILLHLIIKIKVCASCKLGVDKSNPPRVTCSLCLPIECSYYPLISLAGSSRKNESDNSESFSSFGKGLNSLNVNSFDDSSQLSTETQSSVRTGKSVAVGNKIYWTILMRLFYSVI